MNNEKMKKLMCEMADLFHKYNVLSVSEQFGIIESYKGSLIIFQNESNLKALIKGDH